jgi:GDP-L-fucose synthase
MKILLTGANGFIARNLKTFFLSDSLEVSVLHRGIADICNRQQVNDFFKDKTFDVVIHCASVGGNRTQLDDISCINTNLSMFYNLMEHRDKFKKFINLGSGAELDRNKHINGSSSLQNCFPTDDYGLSKNIIAKVGSQIPNFYNVRIFNVFNHDELETRMIKNNIKKYINKENIIIHQDKYMDFFYINDLYRVLINIILNTTAPKTIDCSYPEKLKLSDIANKINNLSDYKVDVVIENEGLGNEYRGNPSALYPTNLILNIKGLDFGLRDTYERLLKI